MQIAERGGRNPRHSSRHGTSAGGIPILRQRPLASTNGNDVEIDTRGELHKVAVYDWKASKVAVELIPGPSRFDVP